MRNRFVRPLGVLCCWVLSSSCFAEVSVTTTLVSDYLFNGVSQTNDKPTVQGSLDWWNDAGWYAGSFASGVDYGEGTDYELDYYVGYTGSLSEHIAYDAGVAMYTYLGGDDSSQYDYAEAYLALSYNDTRAQIWYSNDYFGSGARHYIVALSQAYQLNDDVLLTFQIDRSTSLDPEQYSWDTNDKDYIHVKTEAAFSWLGLDFTLGLEKTDLEYDKDIKALGTIGYTFGL